MLGRRLFQRGTIVSNIMKKYEETFGTCPERWEIRYIINKLYDDYTRI